MLASSFRALDWTRLSPQHAHYSIPLDFTLGSFAAVVVVVADRVLGRR